ncbi:MAG: hypothetical protein COT06_05335 [Syntrophobacteraceae bacterium CG07_land_8_20_14_0_80_61_8]|nr:MAG: hypothetical protein COT06_05335 [Syntrophobacteraceae bacterium CG07_land_8_20_14_0_80_61_8]
MAMFRDRRNRSPYRFDPMLNPNKRKRLSPVGILAAVLVLSLFAAGAVLLSWGGHRQVSGKWIERLPFPGRLTGVELRVNGAPQTVAAGATLVMNPRDTLQIGGLHTDGWWSRGVRLDCAEFDLEPMRQAPVPIGRFIPAETLMGPKDLAMVAKFLGTEVGRIVLRVELDGRDWKERAAASRSPREKLDYLQKALAADPGNTLLKMQLAGLLTEQKEYARAADLYREVLKQGRTRTVLEKLLDLHKRAGEVDAALNVYLDLLASEGDSGLFTEMLAYLRKHKSAADTVEFLERHGKDIPRSMRGHYYLFLAQAYTDSKSWARAADAYQKALGSGARDPNIYYNMAVASEQSSNAEGAIAALRQYLKTNPDDVESWMRLAGMFQKRGDKEQERKVYERVLTLNPKNEQALVRLVALLEKGGKSDALIDAYEKLAKLKPDDTVVQFNLAVHSYDAQDWDRATKAFERLVEKDPKDLKSRKYLLDLHTRAGNEAGRIKVLNQLIAAEPDQGKYYDALIGIYEKKKDYQGMAAAAAKAAAKFPKNVQYQQNILLARLKQGDEKGALETLEALIHLEPKEKKWMQQAARLYEKLKNYEAALKKVQQILELDPKDKQANDDYLRLANKKLGLGR